MSYKSGHIYLVDKEPTNEDLANFSKPVQFDICKNGLFYSVLYDKNGNRYVEDRSKITTGFIKLGNIVRMGNIINIGVHPSGFNHWRINGVDVTSSNPATLELEPETNLYRIDSIVGNGAGGLFLFQGDADKNPLPTNSLNYPNYAFFKDVLITPNSGGSIDPEILNNYVAKEEENWKEITLGISADFVIDYSDERTRFKISSLGSAAHTLTGIVFSDDTERAVEFWVYNNTGEDININNVATSGLRKGFEVYGAPFKIIANGKALLKYNPETNIIECWKVNSTSGGISTVTTDSTLKGKGSPTEPLGISDAKNDEIAGKATQTQLATKQDKSLFSALVDKMVHYYDSITQKMQSTGVEFISAGILKLKSIILTTNSGTALPNELGTDGTNVVFGASKKKLAFKDEIFEHNVRGKVIESTGVTGTYNCDLNAATSWILTLTGNTTIDFTNMILADETITISMNVTGNFTLTFPSWLKLSPYADLYDGTKINRIVIEIGKGGSTPSGWYNLIIFDSNA